MATTTADRLGVLLIEDDDDDALIVSDLLTGSAPAIHLARGSTLGEGLDRLSAGVSCVLLDLRLPDADGLDGVRRLRAAAPWTAVIVLTGLDDEQAGEAAVEAGAQDYLVKGQVDGPLLHRAIRYAVSRRHAEDVLAQLRLAELRAEENARLERGLVPHPIVLNEAVWVASSYHPGRRRALIGGDFYDAVQTADGRLHVVIGDVSGRGPDEAALGAALRISWRALTLSGVAGDAVLHTLQTMIEAERQHPATFATLCTLLIDPSVPEVTVRRAGHPAPMVMAGAAVRSLPLSGGGPPIGMFGGADWPSSRFALHRDWTMLLYTDGIIEARDGDRGLLGEDGLEAVLTELMASEPPWRENPGLLLESVVDAARARHGEEFSDDVALLALGAR